MTSKRIGDLPPQLGDVVLDAIERVAGCDCHIVIIAVPVDANDELGQPTFVTSLHPQAMQELVTQIAGGFALAGKPVIHGKHTRGH